MAVSIDDQLKAFLEGPVSIVVGTRDSRMAPEITRAWGARVLEDRRVSMCVPLGTSRKTLDNIESNGDIAATFALPTDYRAFQLKGVRATICEPDAEDITAVERHREGFSTVNIPLGQTRERLEGFFRAEMETSPVLVKIVFTAEQIFDQTPGPGAGKNV
jgi:hypothetical protein